MTDNPDVKIVRATRDPTHTAVSRILDDAFRSRRANTSDWSAPDNRELYHILRRLEHAWITKYK